MGKRRKEVIPLRKGALPERMVFLLFFFLAELTALLALGEVEAGVGGQDWHHLVVPRPSHLRGNSDV